MSQSETDGQWRFDEYQGLITTDVPGRAVRLIHAEVPLFRDQALAGKLPPKPGTHATFDAHRERAEFIVRACNSHAELLAALREIAETPCDHGPGFCARKIAQAALKQAEGRGA